MRGSNTLININLAKQKRAEEIEALLAEDIENEKYHRDYNRYKSMILYKTFLSMSVLALSFLNFEYGVHKDE